jgi:hypothetical protein
MEAIDPQAGADRDTWRDIWTVAGAAGIDPTCLTLRELLWYADARTRAQWSRTANLMSLIANCHRDPKKTSPYRADDFNPFAERREETAQPADIGLLKRVFIDREAP